MRIFYFIGPSGVGKSAICEELSKKDLSIKYEELDSIYKEYKVNNKNHDLAVKKTKEKLEEIERLNDDKIHLVDVGAFAQKYVDFDLWEQRKDRLVCLKNDISFCYNNYKKRSSKRMDFEKWKKSELNPKRKELYSLAKYNVDSTNLDISKTKQKVLEIINQI